MSGVSHLRDMYRDAMDRIKELEAAILVHRQQEPHCRCGFEIVLPSEKPRADAKKVYQQPVEGLPPCAQPAEYASQSDAGSEHG
jgi:hypothetical protein